MKWIKSRKIYESSELEMSVSDILQPLKDEDLDLKTKFTSDGKIFISILKVRLDYDFVIEHLNHVISFLESEDYSLNDVIIDYVSGVGELKNIELISSNIKITGWYLLNIFFYSPHIYSIG